MMHSVLPSHVSDIDVFCDLADDLGRHVVNIDLEPK